jgi:hypothetical protein
MRRWLLAGIVLVLIGVGVAGAIWGDGDWGPDRHHDVVTQVNNPDGTQTIVVQEGHGGFFPFGFLLFPLVILFWVLVFRAFVFRGPWGRNGPWTRGGPPAGEPPDWFEEWHRRAHVGPGENQPPATPTPS